MKIYLSLLLFCLGSQVFAQENQMADSAKFFGFEGKHRTLEIKGLFLIIPIGNGHVTQCLGGLGVRVFKRHHIGFDAMYSTSVDHSDGAIDTLGVTHPDGDEESHSKGNAYTAYYHYHFNLFHLNEKKGLNFFVGAFYRYGIVFYKNDPLFVEQYISQRETSHDYGISTGITKTFKEFRGLRIEAGIGIGKQELRNYTKYKENNTFIYKTEKSSYAGFDRVELGVYWTFL